LKGGDFEYLDHAADVGIRGFGSSPEAVSLRCEAANLEELSVAHLNELVSLADSRHLVLGRFEANVRNEGKRWMLDGRAFGEERDPARHGGAVEVKGATFTGLRVAPDGGRWVAQCVVDV
jgi:SHS2 domain-containing protein